ncbi:tumor necrosis factor receptor superfamily member 6 isoform X2 [Ahaetulla prasina]|uniref:tumor necrosis factor receptor superfamily member 6 isoform X2 n=1 Tax=Ahaetulla prasina TaxID=499056 RepID=UPI002647865A|nr:tumor necrosis factor receptor superfamily member 6 isoform X2 [Ahaetulla prasina]
MFQLLLFLIICPILDSTAAKSLRNSGSVPTNQNCPRGQYFNNGVCCDFCKPGSVVKTLDCTSNPKTNCKPCTEGKDYMDKDNYKTTCLRCNYCDAVHGMEPEKKCTITQNVKCRCMIGFFCNSTKPCRHCEKCDLCKNGIVVKECTPTQNTICREKDTQNAKDDLLWLCLILPVVALLVGLILWQHYRPRIQRRPNIPDQKGSNDELDELKEDEYPDIDLKPYIPEIVRDMEVNHVRKLVRKLGIRTAEIDEIAHDNLNDSSEQKIKLLERWYKTCGIKGSYKTLITSLRELKFYDAVNKINQMRENSAIQKIKRDVTM